MPAMPFKCPHCDTALTSSEITSGVCPVCGKRLSEPAGEAAGEAAPPAYRGEPAYPPRPRTREPQPVTRAGNALGVASLCLAMTALLLAGIALLVALLRNPLGRGLQSYDLSTPRAALFSDLDMNINQDFRARMELNDMLYGKRTRERRRTMQVHKEADWTGKKILFVTFEERGIKKHETIAFEKDSDSGMWHQSYADEFSIQRENQELADQIRAWRESGDWNAPRPRQK